MAPKRTILKDLNEYLTCTLCGGYYIDATALVECLHVFCRGCILRYFENCKQSCPTCNAVNKKKNLPCFRPDVQLQTLVYKLVPGLYSKEMQRRDDFYRSTGVRASSSCSDDSVLGDMMEDHEQWVSSYEGDQTPVFYGPEDSISLSLEYYQHFLDNEPLDSTKKDSEVRDAVTNGARVSNISDSTKTSSDNSELKCVPDSNRPVISERRFLQCPAAVTMSHLQKFVRMKYALTGEHRVDIIYKGEVLPNSFSLMDVAYTFNWTRVKPMRFFYRIFTPLKIRPIKIINTCSTGGKHPQIVSVKPTTETQTPKTEETSKSLQLLPENQDTESQNYKNKEKLMANLQLQSKNKINNQNSERVIRFLTPEPYEKPEKKKTKTAEIDNNCIFEYEEPDKEEIKRFAEKRDREWAMQKHLDEQQHHMSKKRKKNKHSKNESVHKKRKLHAEITSNEVLNKEESLKLKVKLTQHNGHKHKHHKSSQNQPAEENKTQELSSKEKLLQMRQVRHKHISSDEKKQTNEATPQKIEPAEPTKEIEEKKIDSPPKAPDLVPSKTLRSDFTIKTSPNKELIKQPSSSDQEKQSQKAFMKKLHEITETYSKLAAAKNENTKNKAEIKPAVKVENKIAKVENKIAKVENKVLKVENKVVVKNQNTNNKIIQQNDKKNLERKIANLKQQCTIEIKAPVEQPKNDPKKVNLSAEKQKILPSTYQTGFTVSKIESGVKRKAGTEENTKEKRPSLEITLINPSPPPPTPTTTPTPPEVKPVKRPPPATIPLERIKKTYSKILEKCDNIGALDLSKHKPNEIKLLNGNTDLKNKINQQKPPQQEKNMHMSNLQMLSKVALEHPTLNKPPAQVNKVKPQIPNLQTLKIPVPQNSTSKPTPNLVKLPKLNEINKSNFRFPNPQVRNMRPNQNQSIRNIPNPSLLIRQQNQNRLNSINQNVDISKDGSKTPPSSSTTTTTTIVEVTKKPESEQTKNTETTKAKEEKSTNSSNNNSK